MKNRIMAPLLAACLCLFITATTLAVDISNYSDCSVCHGSIHYAPDEAWGILGKEAFDLVSRLGKFRFKNIKLDLDGVLSPGSKTDPDMGYELAIFGSSDVFYLKNLLDDSYIQVLTGYSGVALGQNIRGWSPEIYLQAAEKNAIDLEDSPDQAWDKMKTSNIYRWVLQDQSHEQWESLMKEKILMALKIIGAGK